MTEIFKIKKLLKGKTKEQKIEFCNQCLEEPNKYRQERIFALKEYKLTLSSQSGGKE